MGGEGFQRRVLLYGRQRESEWLMKGKAMMFGLIYDEVLPKVGSCTINGNEEQKDVHPLQLNCSVQVAILHCKCSKGYLANSR